jgi:hypothetical protein
VGGRLAPISGLPSPTQLRYGPPGLASLPSPARGRVGAVDGARFQPNTFRLNVAAIMPLPENSSVLPSPATSEN